MTPGKKLDPITRSISVGPGSCKWLSKIDEDKNAQINAEGRYVLSTFENSKTRAFSKLKRESLVNKNQLLTPGPGNYNAFSTFGWFSFP